MSFLTYSGAENVNGREELTGVIDTPYVAEKEQSP